MYNIGIVGTGMIGASMACLFTGNSYSVSMYAVNEAERERCLSRYHTYFSDLLASGLVTEENIIAAEKLLDISLSYDALSGCDFVFECVVELEHVKHEVYAQLEKHCKNLKAIASSSSAMSPEALCRGLSDAKKPLLAVAHPWNPPHLVPCVEVVPSTHTSKAALGVITEILESCGRAPVVMNRPIEGFVANRLQQALYREAAYMAEQGIASPQDIDRALMTSFAPRYTSIGIFEHYDYAGLDMIMSIEDTVYPTLCDQKTPHDIVRKNYEAGNLGAKTGKGILDWSGVDMDEFRKRASAPYLKFFNWKLPR